MHISRIIALLGVIVGAVGLFLKALTSPGESIMEALSESVEELPSVDPDHLGRVGHLGEDRRGGRHVMVARLWSSSHPGRVRSGPRRP